MAWHKAPEASRLLGISSPEALRKRGRRGTVERKWDSLYGAYLYYVDDNARESVLDDIEALHEDDKRNQAHEEDRGYYDAPRDVYVVKTDKRRPRIIEGWIYRHIRAIEGDRLPVQDIQIEAPPRLPRLKLKKDQDPFAVFCTPTDFHYGKYGWSVETNTGYSRDEARTLLMQRTDDLLSLVAKYGQPDVMYVGVGSDWFHIDTDSATTTAGTPQDTDGSYAQIFSEGCQLFVDFVEMLRSFCPSINLIFMPGNHDRTSSLGLMTLLTHMYKDTEGMTTTTTPAERQYVTYGNSLICVTHGDSARSTDIPGIMAYEAAQEWGEAEHRMVFSGHLHHQQVKEHKGVMMYQMGSLSGTDRWHSRKGFVGSKRVLSAYLIDRDRGCIGQLDA
jgi:predicted phosphodiesterase